MNKKYKKLAELKDNLEDARHEIKALTLAIQSLEKEIKRDRFDEIKDEFFKAKEALVRKLLGKLNKKNKPEEWDLHDLHDTAFEIKHKTITNYDRPLTIMIGLRERSVTVKGFLETRTMDWLDGIQRLDDNLDILIPKIKAFVDEKR